MYNKELLDITRKEAQAIRKAFKERQPSGINMDGAFTAAPSRAQMRKTVDYIKKDSCIRPVLNYIEEVAPFIRGIIPHPVAWDVQHDDDTCYLHTVDGTDVECAYTKTEDKTVIHTLVIDGREFIEGEKVIEHKKHKYGPF